MSRSNQRSPEDQGHAFILEAGGRAVEPGSSDEFALSHLIKVIQRRRRIIIAAVIVAVLLGGVYCFVKTPRYEAIADVAINPEGSNSLDMGDITASLGGGGLGFDEKLETQVRVLKSKSLAWTVISDLRLDKEPTFAGTRKHVFFGPYTCSGHPDQIEEMSPACRNAIWKQFAKSLSVTNIPRTQAVEITYRNANPTLACEIVNHLVSAYTRRTFTTRFDDTMKTSNWLSGQMTQLKTNIMESQAKLAKFQKETGIFGTDENNNLVLSKLDDLSKEVTDAEADRIVKEAQYRIAQSGNPELIGTIVPDSVLPVLRGQEADLKRQLTQATSEFGPQYPEVIQLGNQLAQVEESLQKEVANIQERFRTIYQTSADTENQLRKAFEQQRKLASDMSEGLDEYGILKREVESGNNLYDDLSMKLKEAGAVASLKAATVDAIDLAVLPTEPIEPDIPLVFSLVIFLGFGSGIGFAFIAENLDTSIRSQGEIESLSAFPLFGVIPHASIQSKKLPVQESATDATAVQTSFIVSLQRPRSQFGEAFTLLRTSLQLASAGSPPKTILIASAVPSEGKTTVSVNTAAVLSKQAERVLLVDADLRRGHIEKDLGISKNFGLSGSLTGAGSWRDAVVALPDAPNLFVLQCGTRPPNPAELLGSSQLRGLLEEFKGEFDHVIIDSPPVLLVTDALLIAQSVDVVLLVSRIGTTPRAGLRRAVALLQASKVGIEGLVVNDVGQSDSYYGYGYGYGYGLKKGYYSDDEV